jgi:glutamyl-tRNA synthetase
MFGHMPLILGEDKKRLSKRHGATAVGEYQTRGILPEALFNFLALLGWSPGGDSEILPESEMIALFSLEGIQKKASVFDLAKLEWMNGQYLSQEPAATLAGPVRHHLDEMGVTLGNRALEPLIDAVKARSRTLLDIASQVAVRVDAARIMRDAKGIQLASKMGEAFGANLKVAATALSALSPAEWEHTTLEATLKSVAERESMKLGDLMQPIRVALTGGTVSEPVNELLAVVGREESLARIARAAGS